jgi:anti-sigma28 factor (negative regulator of flagellin synthesis)
MDWAKIARLRTVIDKGDFEFDVSDFVDGMLRDSPFRSG